MRAATAMREVQVDHGDLREAIGRLERQLTELSGELRGQRDELRHLREHIESNGISTE